MRGADEILEEIIWELDHMLDGMRGEKVDPLQVIERARYIADVLVFQANRLEQEVLLKEAEGGKEP